MADIKYVPDPDAWPGNGPPWLFEDSTPEEIALMQQMAIDATAGLQARQSDTNPMDETTGDRMHATFYEHRVFGHPEPCGVVTLENGVAQIPPELDFINTTAVYDRNDERLLMPADGAVFIEALPFTFKNAYSWAEVESRTGPNASAMASCSPTGYRKGFCRYRIASMVDVFRGYPSDCRSISRRIRERDGFRCRWCGLIGIRTPWTLAAPTVWERTHRLGGYLLTTAGLVSVASLPATSKRASRLPLVSTLGVVGLSSAYSFVVYVRRTRSSR